MPDLSSGTLACLQVRGWVPIGHLSDVIIEDAEANFKAGQAVKCYVLKTDNVSTLIVSMKSKYEEQTTPEDRALRQEQVKYVGGMWSSLDPD